MTGAIPEVSALIRATLEWDNVEFNSNVHCIHWEPDDFITANVITMNRKGINDSPLSYFPPFPQHLFFGFKQTGPEPTVTSV